MISLKGSREMLATICFLMKKINLYENERTSYWIDGCGSHKITPEKF
jgi:hypothetical protein